MNRRLVYRWIAAGSLWLLIIIIVINSIRSVNIVNKTGSVAKNALTEKNEQILSGVRNTADAFAVEWATFNGNNNDYNNRLGFFLNRQPTMSSPEGIQEVTSSSVLAYESKNAKDYRVKVLLHVRRLAPVDSSNTNLPASLIPVTREDVVKLRSMQYDIMQQTTVGWQHYMICVEVPVKIVNSNPVINGLPVVINRNNAKGEITQPKNFGAAVPPDFVTFINQFMNMYFGGQALNNFIVSDVNVLPIHGWKLVSVDEVKADSENPTKACVYVTVSTPGISKMTQIIYLKVQSVRGSYLIENLESLGE